jgi:hypothetical protein
MAVVAHRFISDGNKTVLPHTFSLEKSEKKMVRICSDDAILFMGRDLRFDKGKIAFPDILYDKIIPIRVTPL